MEVPKETSSVISGASLPQSGEIVLAKFEALTSHGNDSGSNIPEQIEEQVLGYLEVQPSEVQLVQDSNTIYLQPQEIEIDGEHLILAQGEEAGEIIVVVSTDQEHSADQAVAELAQGTVVNATVMHSESGGESKARMFVVNQSNAQFDDDRKLVAFPSTKTEVGQLAKSLSNEQVIITPQTDKRVTDNAGMQNTENILLTELSKNLSGSMEKDLVSTKDILSECNISSSSQELKDRKLMQLACIAHEMQIERSQVMKETDDNTSIATTEVPRKTYSNEIKHGINSSVGSIEYDVVDVSTGVSSDAAFQDQPTSLEVKSVVTESPISEVSSYNQTSDSEERSRRSMEAAETIAALQHSDRLPLYELNQLSQNDQSVPNYASTLTLLENSSLAVPERHAECSSVSSDANTFSLKANKMKKVESQYGGNECENRSESEVVSSSSSPYVAASTEEIKISEVIERQLEKENLATSNSCANILAEELPNHVEEPHSNAILASNVVDVKVGEPSMTESSEETSNGRKGFIFESCKETMLETSFNKQTDINFPPLSQIHSFPLGTDLTKSMTSNVVKSFESYNKITEDHSNKKEISDDDNMDMKHKNNLAEKCTETNSVCLPLTIESASKLQVGDDSDVMDDGPKCVSDLNNSKVNALNTNERTKTKETTSLKDTFSQDMIKSSSSQAVSTEIVTDNSFDQVVPQIDIAGSSVGKNSETISMCQGTNDSLFINKQEELLNSSDIQKITSLQDLHNREDFQQKLIGQSLSLNTNIPCIQKDESYNCDSQIKHNIHSVSSNLNADEIRTVAKICDKIYSPVSSAVKGFTEERKRIVQTVEYVQKQSFIQSSARPLRPKQPVVIHLRSSIAKPAIDDLNKGETSNKPLACDAKEIKENNETLSKSELSETEENCSNPQLRIVNDNESINTISAVQENVNISEEHSSATATNSFIELQSMESSDHSSVESETSHSSVEMFNDQLDMEKESTESEAKQAFEERTEYLTPKIKKQFQLLISPEKSDAEVNFTSIKSKIYQKLQFDSDANDSMKDMEVVCEGHLSQAANNEQESQEEQSPTDVKKSIIQSEHECESIIQSEHENEEIENISESRGFKRKSSSSPWSVNKISKSNVAESTDSAVKEDQIELFEKDKLKKVEKRKASCESEQLLKQPRISLKKQTDAIDEVFKSKKASPVQKIWLLRSHSASMKEVKEPKSKLDAAKTIGQPIEVQSIAEANSLEAPIEESIDNSVEAQKVHPVNDKIELELLSPPSVPMLEPLAEDSDHSGISEVHMCQPPVLITRNKFLNSNNSLSPKSKKQYIKKHVKSKSVPLSVQKVQSPRKYSPKAAKSLILPPTVTPQKNTVTPQKKHLRTKSEQILPTNLEEIATTPVKICDFRIRCQTPTTPTEKIGNYSCVGCCFRTSRVQNLIHHYREKCFYTGPDAFHWDVDQIEGAKREDSQKTFKANGCSAPKHIIDTGKNMIGSNTNTSTKKLHIKSGDKMEETVDSDSNSDDLPPAFDTPSKKKFGFAEDDVVWVEWKTLHWPALVRKIYMKPKKASIMFIDSPSVKKGIRVSIKKISTFNNAEMNKKYLSEGRAVSLHSDTLVKAVQKAEDFLRKRCLGINISAAQFFGNLDDFPEYMSDKGSSTGTPSESGDIVHERHLSEVSSNRSFSPVLRISEESVKQDETVTEDRNEASDPETLARRKEKRKHQNSRLLQCIKDGKVETHLLGVYRNTIKSERHKLFHSNVASERNQLKHVSWFGPIDDEEQQEEIYDYCLQLFKSACQYKETFDLVAYMFEVWVPEAVVRAISRERRLSMSQAEDTFAKGVHWSKAEKEEARKEFVNFPFTEEERREHREKVADSLRIAGVEENIIQALDL